MPGEWQGTEGFKSGNLRRYLETVTIFQLDAGVVTVAGNFYNSRVWLRGLTGNLKVSVNVGMLPANDDGNNTPYVWPANGATLQLYPVTDFPDAQRKVFLRPVFQDPTNVTNTNAPLPQELPFGWEGAFTMADQVMIETIFAASNWTLNQTGTIVAQVAVEYNGVWWDIAAIAKAMGKVSLSGNGAPLVVGTRGGG